MELNKNSREIKNKFRCPICLEMRLRGSHVITKKGPYKDIELKTCNSAECQDRARAGRWGEMLLKLVVAASFAFMVSGCAQSPGTNILGLAQKQVSSQWVPEPNATQPAVLPFNAINLAPIQPNQISQTTYLSTSNVTCYGTVNLHGDQSQGTFDLEEITPGNPACGATSIVGTYQRIGTQSLEFCSNNGATCGLYQ